MSLSNAALLATFCKIYFIYNHIEHRADKQKVLVTVLHGWKILEYFREVFILFTGEVFKAAVLNVNSQFPR